MVITSEEWRKNATKSLDDALKAVIFSSRRLLSIPDPDNIISAETRKNLEGFIKQIGVERAAFLKDVAEINDHV